MSLGILEGVEQDAEIRGSTSERQWVRRQRFL